MDTICLRGTKYACPFLNILPPLTPRERAELLADIKRNGITYPIVITDQNEVLDGHHRLSIAVELGLSQVPMKIVAGLSEAEKRERAEDLNVHRRQLTRAQRRELVARRIRTMLDRSDREIAAATGADHKTVAAIRRGLESTGEIPQLGTTVGKDGKKRGPKIRRPEATPTTWRGKLECLAADLAESLKQLRKLARRADEGDQKPEEVAALLRKVKSRADAFQRALQPAVPAPETPTEHFQDLYANLP